MRIRDFAVVVAIALAFAACSKEQTVETTHQAKEQARSAARRVTDALDITVPVGAQPDQPQVRERERFDQQWRQLQTFHAQQAQQQAAAAAAAAQALPSGFRFVTGQKQSFKGLDANAINAAPVDVPITGDVRGPSVLRAQVYLDQLHFSVGSIDGRWGRNSAITVWWYQRARNLPTTGDVDENTFRVLAQEAHYAPVVRRQVLTAEDVQGPFVTIPSSVYDQQNLSCMCYQSIREKLSEEFHSTEDFLELLNPDVKFSELKAGDAIVVPNVRPAMTTDQKDFAKVVISLAGNSFSAFDAAGKLLFHAPTTVGSQYDPSPNETVKVVSIVPDPYFHYDPTLFAEVPDTDPDAHLKPGPNSPVGIVWIALSKPHYGIHGNEDPDSIGYTSSHGCIRLTNWDALEVEHRISVGTPVEFVDTRSKGMPAVAKKQS